MSATPFDDAFKHLVELDPAAWAAWVLGRPVAEAEAIDSDLATVAGRADKVIRTPQPGRGDLLIDIEAESSHAGDAPPKQHAYSTLLARRHGLPVRSILLLLRPDANATAATGVWEVRKNPDDPDEEPYIVFRYRVVRLWKQPLEPLLVGSPALLPLAPLTNAAQADLPGTVSRAVARPRAETPRDETGRMVSAMAVMLGLRYEEDVVDRLFSGVLEMEESSYYQLIKRKGEPAGQLREARETIMRQGQRKFGPLPDDRRAALEALSDLGRLRELMDRVPETGSWDDFLKP